MNRIGYLWLFLWLSLAQAEEQKYYLVDVYGALLHGLMFEHTLAQPDLSERNLRYYMYQKPCITIFADALNMGYSRLQVTKTAYRIALKQPQRNERLIAAFNYDMRDYQMRKDFHYYVTTYFTTFSALMNLFGVGFYIVYYSKDRKAIKHYMQGGYAVFLNPYAGTT